MAPARNPAAEPDFIASDSDSDSDPEDSQESGRAEAAAAALPPPIPSPIFNEFWQEQNADLLVQMLRAVAVPGAARVPRLSDGSEAEEAALALAKKLGARKGNLFGDRQDGLL